MTGLSFVEATVASWVVLLGLGRLTSGWVAGVETSAGAAPELLRRSPVLWALALGELSMAVFLTLACGQWAGPTQATPPLGFMNGAMIGALVGFSANLIHYATHRDSTLRVVGPSTLVTTLRFGLAGAAIGGIV